MRLPNASIASITLLASTTLGISCTNPNASSPNQPQQTVETSPAETIANQPPETVANQPEESGGSGVAGPAITQVSVGSSHACALTSDGAAKCWGENQYGKLGDNSDVSKEKPTDVSGLASNVKAISAGSNHTCALTSSGAVKCWGGSGWGKIGDNSKVDRWVPTGVHGLASNVSAISAGYNHTCVLTSRGAVKCWGNNQYGRLGNNSNVDKWVPTAVYGLSSNVRAISSGNYHTCALTSNGAVKCWGDNSYGQLGNNSNVNKLVPTAVHGLSSKVNAISAGNYHTCALTSDGAAMCWGRNLYGQLGDNTKGNKPVPTAVYGLSSGVRAISAGSKHTCAVTSGGDVKCWGFNGYVQIGNFGKDHKLVPIDVTGLSSDIAEISAGDSYT